MLAKRGHMPGWFNQCPVASGITDPRADRNRSVDLVHWCESDRHLHLVELKWETNSPLYALFEVLEYGLAYIFCRIHKDDLCLQCPSLMDASHVSLEVVAPLRFYSGYNERDLFAQMSQSLNGFVDSKINGLTMSLKVLAFPDGFNIPFKNGKEVKEKRDTVQLTAEDQEVRDAFNNLAPVWP